MQNIFDGGSIMFPFPSGKTFSITKSEGHLSPFDEDILYYFVNILFVDDLPVYLVSLMKDGERNCFIGISVGDEHKDSWKGKTIIDEIYASIDELKKTKDLDGFLEFVHQKFALDSNPIYFINTTSGYVGNTYLLGRKKNSSK